MALVDRVKAILLTPRQEWSVIEAESATTATLFQGYAIPLAAIPALAGFIGYALVGIRILGTSVRVPMGTSLTWAVTQFVGGLVGVYILGLIIDALAPSFGGQKNPIQALKVAVYSSTAAWVAGVFLLIPGLSILTILGLYSLYLLFLGLPPLMKASEDKAIAYTGVVVVAGVVIFYLVGVLAGEIAGIGGWGRAPRLG